MRSVHIEVDRQPGEARSWHEFSFGPEQPIPSGVEAEVSLDSTPVGVVRGINTLSVRGRPARIWEVQLEDLSVVSGDTLVLTLRRVLAAVGAK